MRKSVIVSLTAAVMLSGCWTTHLSLKYQAPAKVTPAAPGTPPITLGTFADERGYKPNWIGRQRGTFGNSLERLVVDESVATLVRTEFRDGLLAREFTVVDNGGQFELAGTIRKLSAIQYVHIEVDVEIQVRLRRSSSQADVFSQTYPIHIVEASKGYSVP